MPNTQPNPKRPRRGPYLQWLDPDKSAQIPRTTKWQHRQNEPKNQEQGSVEQFPCSSGIGENSEEQNCMGDSGSQHVSLSDQSSAGSSDSEEESLSTREIVQSKSNILLPCQSDGVSLERMEEMEILSDSEIISDNDEGSNHEDAAASPSDSSEDHLDYMIHGNNEETEGASDPLSSFEFLKQVLQKDTFCTPIREKVSCSSGEILLMALNIARQFCIPVEGLLAILKLVNSIFVKSVVPDTRYKLDKLLCGDEPSYHFYCQDCTEYLGGKPAEESIIVCPNCSTSNQVSNLCNATYFVTIDIAEQLQLLLADDKQKLVKPSEAAAKYDGTIRDIYDGEMYRKFAASLPDNPTCQYASLAFCTDGTPLFKSSKVSMWPITVMIMELDRSVRNKNVLLAGLWCGPSKPPMDVFLERFVKDMHRLSSSGLKVNLEGEQVVLKLCTTACTMDSVARSPSQGISQHNGEFPCNWCLHRGERQEDTSRKFPLLQDGPPPSRTHAGIIADASQLRERQMAGEKVNNKLISHVNGVRSMSPLVLFDHFDLVDGMVDDVMHCGWLGVARQLAKPWLDTPQEGLDCYVGSPTNLEIINKRIRQLTCPVEARRFPRSVNEMSFWKAKEWENWTLYYSVPVLSGILPDKYLANWALFVEAMHVLHGTSISPDDIIFAKNLIVRFVAGVEELYGVSHMTFNMHILMHLADNVTNWGSLSDLNAYAFENVNGLLKRVVHANKGVIQQILRVLTQYTAIKILKNSLPLSPRVLSFLKCISQSNYASVSFPFEGGRAFGKASPLIASEEEIFLCSEHGEVDPLDCVTFNKAIINGSLVCASSRERTNNTVVQLHDGSFVKVKKIVTNERNKAVFLFVSVVRTTKFLRHGAHLRGILRLVTHIDDEIKLVSKELVKIVAFSSETVHGKIVIPMPSINNL